MATSVTSLQGNLKVVYNFTVSAFYNILLVHSPKHSALWHLDGSSLQRVDTARLGRRQGQFEVFRSKTRCWADLLGDHISFVPRQLIQKNHVLDWLPRCRKLWAECSDVAKTCKLIRGVYRHAYLKSTASSLVAFTSFIIRRILRSFSHWYKGQKNERKIVMPMTYRWSELKCEAKSWYQLPAKRKPLIIFFAWTATEKRSMRDYEVRAS